MKIQIYKNGHKHGWMTFKDNSFNLDWWHNGCWSCGEAWNHEHVTKLENGEYVHII